MRARSDPTVVHSQAALQFLYLLPTTLWFHSPCQTTHWDGLGEHGEYNLQANKLVLQVTLLLRRVLGSINYPEIAITGKLRIHS